MRPIKFGEGGGGLGLKSYSGEIEGNNNEAYSVIELMFCGGKEKKHEKTNSPLS